MSRLNISNLHGTYAIQKRVLHVQLACKMAMTFAHSPSLVSRHNARFVRVLNALKLVQRLIGNHRALF